MKRKLLAALCVTAMSAGLLVGCGSSDKTEESTKTEETAKEETSSQEETETKAASSDSDNVASFTKFVTVIGAVSASSSTSIVP